MTTIAWDGHTLASDSQATKNSVPMYGVQKIYRLDDALIAGAGDWSDVQKFVDWWKHKASAIDYPDTSDHFEAIVVTKDGAFTYGDCKFGLAITKPSYAIGSGEQAAMALMARGASAVEAVRGAMELDVYTGGDVVSQSAEYLTKTETKEFLDDLYKPGALDEVTQRNDAYDWQKLCDEQSKKPRKAGITTGMMRLHEAAERIWRRRGYDRFKTGFDTITKPNGDQVSQFTQGRGWHAPEETEG